MSWADWCSIGQYGVTSDIHRALFLICHRQLQDNYWGQMSSSLLFRRPTIRLQGLPESHLRFLFIALDRPGGISRFESGSVEKSAFISCLELRISHRVVGTPNGEMTIED
jgi:hypothetical protein